MASSRSPHAKRSLTLLALWSVARAALGQDAVEKSELIEVQLTNASSESATCVRVQFLNRTEINLYIPSYVAEQRSDLSDVFELESRQGEKIAFTGIIAKRQRLTVEDAVLLPASGVFESRICLDELYDIPSDLAAIRYQRLIGVDQLVGETLELYSFELLVSNSVRL